jgi:hypothetical protein
MMAGAVLLLAGATVARAQVSPAPATGVTLAASLPSPHVVGTPVVFTASGVGSSGYDYQFWIMDLTGTTWKLVQNYGGGPTWTMPGTTAPGAYRIAVHVRTSATVNFDAQAGLNFIVRLPPATGVTLSSDKASPQVAGTPVVFTAAGIGSSGYQYRFWILPAGSATWTMVQDYGVGSAWTMPITTPPGSYRVAVHVRTSTSVYFDAQAGADFTLRIPPATGVTITADKASPQTVGTPVTFTASGTGSSGYQYRFWIKPSTSTVWSMVQDYGVGSSWTMPSTTAAGTYRIAVHVRTSPAVYFDAQAGFDITLNPLLAPTVSGITPATGATTGLDPIIIAGSNFAPNATVQLGAGSFATGVVVNAAGTSISAFTPSALALGPVDVIVTNPDGQSFTLPGAFAFTAPTIKPPVLAAVTPNTGSAAGGSAVQITGADLINAATVSFGGTQATITAGGAKLMFVTVPPHAAGVVDVTVTDTLGRTSTLVGGFTYTAIPATTPTPTLTSIVPSSGPDAGGIAVTVNGTNFVAGTTVLFGGVPGAVASFNQNQIVVVTPPHAAGFVDVTVQNPDFQTATLANVFHFVAPGPNINTLNVHGAPMAGGTLILVAGTGFQPGVTVTFGGVPGIAPSYDAVNKVILVTTPPGPANAAIGPSGQPEAFVNVVVTNPDGQSAGIAGFHYGPAPIATDFFSDVDGTKTLNNGKAGQLIDVIGSLFSVGPGRPVPGVQVTFGGLPATSIDLARSNANTLTVGIPKLNPGSYQVTVTNFDGQFSTSPGLLVVPGP